MKLFSQLRTSKQLGWRNCAAVAAHRVALRIGLYQRQLPIHRCPVPEALAGCKQPVPFSSEPWFVDSKEVCLEGADSLLAGRATWFSHEAHEIGSPPDWFLDPASGQHSRMAVNIGVAANLCLPISNAVGSSRAGAGHHCWLVPGVLVVKVI